MKFYVICYVPAQVVYWEKSCSWEIDQNVLSQSDCRIFKSTISPKQIDEITLFFTCWYKFIKIKSWLKIFSMVKNGCGQYGLWTLKLTVTQEWIDGINWFFACWYKLMKIKMWLKIFGVGLVKNGCDHQSGDWTLKLPVSEEWTNGITSFLHVDTDSQKLKADQIFLGGYGQKLVWQVWSWALKLSVSQKWADEINWFFAC